MNGKKLVWNKGARITLPNIAPISSPTPTPSPSPASTSNPVSEIRVSAFGISSLGGSVGLAEISATGFKSYRVQVKARDSQNTLLVDSGITNDSRPEISRQLDFSKITCGLVVFTILDLYSGENGTGSNDNSESNQLRIPACTNSNSTPTTLPSPTPTPSTSSTTSATNQNGCISVYRGQFSETGCPPQDPGLVTDTGQRDGDSCNVVGTRVNRLDGYLECRYKKGREKVWIKLNKEKVAFNSPKGNSVDLCKINYKDPSNPAPFTFGYPMAKPNSGTPRVGSMRALIVPVEFPDRKGEPGVGEKIKSQKSKMKEWVNHFSKGKLDFQVDSIDKWVLAPQPLEFYDRGHLFNYQNNPDGTMTEGQKGLNQIAQDFIDFIDIQVDVSEYTVLYLLWPEGPDSFKTDLVPHQQLFRTKSGIFPISLYTSTDSSVNRFGTPLWVIGLGETTHDWMFLGSAPGSGWPFNFTAAQNGISLSLGGWEWFTSQWLPENQVFCETSNSLSSTEIMLSPLEREDNFTKVAIVTLDATSALVIEAHGVDKWSTQLIDRRFPYGFYGVMAYIVNLKDYDYRTWTVTDINPWGDTLPEDDGNDPRFKRPAYYLPVDGIASNEYSIHAGHGFDGKKDMYRNYISVLGDSFTIKGIKVSHIGTGDYETIRIEPIK